MTRAVLVLEDGSKYEGKLFGSPKNVSGEVVFNTGMVGYVESLTDPSYRGQILVQTYPLIGNYGVPSKGLTDEFGIPIHHESESIQVTGYVIHSLCRKPSHWSSSKTLERWMEEEGVVGIEGIDTRELVKRIRERGVMLGAILTDGELPEMCDPNELNLVEEVSIKRPVKHFVSESFPTVVVIDCGMKYGILRNLLRRGLNVVRVPYDYPAKKVLDFEPGGVVISNGPGDPKMCKGTIRNVKKLLGEGIPILGICLGNQILGLAVGGDTYKLKFGHRGQNHPVVDMEKGKCYITSQNHGYAVREDSLDGTELYVRFINANDKTVEGITDRDGNVVGVQWHPEASPGPTDTDFLFDEFKDRVVSFLRRNG